MLECCLIFGIWSRGNHTDQYFVFNRNLVRAVDWHAEQRICHLVHSSDQCTISNSNPGRVRCQNEPAGWLHPLSSVPAWSIRGLFRKWPFPISSTSVIPARTMLSQAIRAELCRTHFKAKPGNMKVIRLVLLLSLTSSAAEHIRPEHFTRLYLAWSDRPVW